MRLGILLVFGLAFLAARAYEGAVGPLPVLHANETHPSGEAGRTSSAGQVQGEAYTIDGDTIRVNRTTKVRLLGVAAPERDERGGPEATAFMKRLVNGKTVRCDLNGEKTYDRLVGTCYVDGRDIGEAVIRAGLARDCPRYSGGRYAHVEPPQAASLPFPEYCA
ncbi:thermonuclease family protein [Parvibaculum sp.]|uniref:thermonuclease family protein n=1 Tax=Parvibaculum sp. TaxID=2024848 RepID=UPI000C8D8246|nr:thermonuclease family protein [Parvibaculum sp.]MAB14567.1 nuclease [Parvibaculum sp.]